MVVQPLRMSFDAAGQSVCPAWQAIERRQRTRSDSYLLVTQPDHARLSGDLAAGFVSPLFPQLSPSGVAAIGAHDEGWSHFQGERDGADPMLTPEGKPRSFIEFSPHDFTRAWTSSIDHAATLSAIGGILVSRHFAALGEFALSRFANDPGCEELRRFVDRERERQRELSTRCNCSERHLDDGLNALQFCDLLSLALCCGIAEDIEFPQRFTSTPIRMRFIEGVYDLSPSPFQRDQESRREITLQVRAREYPGSGFSTLNFTLR